METSLGIDRLFKLIEEYFGRRVAQITLAAALIMVVTVILWWMNPRIITPAWERANINGWANVPDDLALAIRLAVGLVLLLVGSVAIVWAVNLGITRYVSKILPSRATQLEGDSPTSETALEIASLKSQLAANVAPDSEFRADAMNYRALLNADVHNQEHSLKLMHSQISLAHVDKRSPYMVLRFTYFSSAVVLFRVGSAPISGHAIWDGERLNQAPEFRTKVPLTMTRGNQYIIDLQQYLFPDEVQGIRKRKANDIEVELEISDIHISLEAINPNKEVIWTGRLHLPEYVDTNTDWRT